MASRPKTGMFKRIINHKACHSITEDIRNEIELLHMLAPGRPSTNDWPESSTICLPGLPFEMTTNDAQNDVPISAFQVALNDESEPGPAKVELSAMRSTI